MSEKNQNMERQIIDAAEELFLKRGFTRTSTTEIAQKAGCNQALVHYYFRTKENLFNKLFEEKFLMFIESISIDEECKGGLRERIENIVTKHIDFLCQNPGLPLLLLSEVNRNSDHIGHIFEKMKIHAVRIVGMLETEIAKEREKGLVRDVNGFDLIFNIISLNVFMFIAKPLLLNIREMNDETYVAFINARKDEIIKIIIGGIYL